MVFNHFKEVKHKYLLKIFTYPNSILYYLSHKLLIVNFRADLPGETPRQSGIYVSEFDDKWLLG